MAEQEAEKKKPRMNKRVRKRLWCAAIFLIIVLFALALSWKCGLWGSQSVDEKLAAIEAERAIPDEENAAVFYNQLLEDPNTSLDYRPGFLDNESDTLTLRQPWSGKDYPELAVWIKEHQPLIDGLLEASQFEKCQFPIFIEPYRFTQMKRLSLMRKWAFLLRRAANNDIGQGRTDDAIAKWQCLIQMGRHLHQQPTLADYLVGIAIEALGVNQTIAFLVQGDADENYLQKIELLPLRRHDDWAAVLDRILPVEELAEQKMKEQLGLLDRLKYTFGYGPFASMKDPDCERIRGQDLRILACSRGIHILAALRRYRNTNGRWPESLDEIKSSLPEEFLVDPSNNGSFVYMLTDDGFRLYGKGQNGIDENARRGDGADDQLIWPRTGWKTEQKSANAG